jgi:serine/threonine-protein kinase SRPK3
MAHIMGRCDSPPASQVNETPHTSQKASQSPHRDLNPGLRDEKALEGVEEGNDVYRLDGFHPVYIGDMYNDRYKILNKIGYGMYSTVWLVEDI